MSKESKKSDDASSSSSSSLFSSLLKEEKREPNIANDVSSHHLKHCWTCEACTFECSFATPICPVCKTIRKWKCIFCTAENRGVNQCASCQTLNVEVEKQKVMVDGQRDMVKEKVVIVNYQRMREKEREREREKKKNTKNQRLCDRERAKNLEKR